MTRFRLKSELVPTLTEKGFIDEDGMMTLRIPCRISGESNNTYEVIFHHSEVLEPDSRTAAVAISTTAAPRLMAGGGWAFLDPDIMWFEEIAEDVNHVVKRPRTHGEEILSKAERRLINEYAKQTGTAVPKSKNKLDNTALLNTAANFKEARS